MTKFFAKRIMSSIVPPKPMPSPTDNKQPLSLILYYAILTILLLTALVSLLSWSYKLDLDLQQNITLADNLTEVGAEKAKLEATNLKKSHADKLLLWIVLVSGALGSCVHAITSLTSFLGNRTFRQSWQTWYLLRPLLGCILAIVFYLMIRGGFLLVVMQDTSDVKIDPYGIAAIAALAGLFSKQAIDKLREVFDSLFQSNSGDQERLDKLEANRMVENIMIRSSEIVGLYADKDSDINGIKISELERLLTARVTRVPIFKHDKSLFGIVHKSLLHEFVIKKSSEQPESDDSVKKLLSKHTLADLLKDHKSTVVDEVAFIPDSSTIDEARKAMLTFDRCQDIFITKTGKQTEPVLGWLTNGIIERHFSKDA